MAKTNKTLTTEIVDRIANKRMVVPKLSKSQVRLVVDIDGVRVELPHVGRDQWGTDQYANAQFASTGKTYVPSSTYIVEDSQDFRDAMRAQKEEEAGHHD